MQPLPRYFLVDGKLIKIMHTKGKIIAQQISSGQFFPPATAISKGKELTEKEAVKEKVKLLKSHRLIN